MAEQLDDRALLEACERMRPLPRPWREVSLLGALTGESPESVAALTIGERDRRLLDVRARTLGDRLECRTSCPSCGSALEWEQEIAALQVTAVHVDPHLELGDGVAAVCRPPDSRDVAACRTSLDPAGDLFRRCVALIDPAGETSDVTRLPESARAVVEAHIAGLDPAADLTTFLTCAVCGHGWDELFDPAAFVMDEIDAYSQRLLEEVHELARVYGWSEREILAMPRSRRRRYLELILA